MNTGRAKNVALNTALDAARARGGIGAQLLVFTDDDAIPENDFLQIWASVGDEKPDHDLFGGQVTAEFTSAPPAWLDACCDHFDVLFAQNEHAEGDIPARRIFGPNMAVRGRIFDHGHRFDETIGPNGKPDYAMGGETEFCVRAERELGAKAWFVDRVRVRHLVRTWQMTPEFFAARAVRHGRGVARQQGGNGRFSPRCVLRAGWGYLSNRARASLPSTQGRYHADWQANWCRGYLEGSLARGMPRVFGQASTVRIAKDPANGCDGAAYRPWCHSSNQAARTGKRRRPQCGQITGTGCCGCDQRGRAPAAGPYAAAAC